MKKYDKSLIEVWEWKNNVYQDVKNLTAKEYIEKIKSDAETILLEEHIKLTTIIFKRKHQNIS
jgi:hypothetical protein